MPGLSGLGLQLRRPSRIDSTAQEFGTSAVATGTGQGGPDMKGHILIQPKSPSSQHQRSEGHQGILGTESSLLTQGSGAASLRLLKTGKRQVCGLVVGCHSRGQEAQSQATQHSAVPALFSGGLHHNLHPNPRATAGGTSPPTITCLARPSAPFPTTASCFSSPRSPDRGRAFLIYWDSQASLGTIGTNLTMAHSLVLVACTSLQEWVGVGRVPAGHLGHSLPSKSGWEQAEGLQLAQRRACFLPERPPAAQGAGKHILLPYRVQCPVSPVLE